MLLSHSQLASIGLGVLWFILYSFNLVVNIIIMRAIKLNEFCSLLLTRVALFNK